MVCELDSQIINYFVNAAITVELGYDIYSPKYMLCEISSHKILQCEVYPQKLYITALRRAWQSDRALWRIIKDRSIDLKHM